MPLLTKSVADAYTARKSTATGSGNYLNPRDLTEGTKTRITFLGDESATGFIVWADSASDPGKRVKLIFASEPTKEDVITRADEQNAVVQPDFRVQQFFTFAIWNYNDEAVQVFEFSQRSLAEPIIDFLSDEEVESEPHLFDLVLSATGKGIDKKYSVLPMPGKRRQAATDKAIDAAWQKVLEDGFDLSVVIAGGNPFSGKPF
jgi:hypothetical protein